MTNKKIKFDNLDRSRSISEIEKIFGVKLNKILDNRKAYLSDEIGNHYIIVGGQWFHGIAEQIFENEEINHNNSILILAKKDDHIVELYKGDFKLLLKSKRVFIELCKRS